MPSRIDKFQFVQSGPFLDPTLAPADPLDSIRQILSHPFCVPIPLNVGGAVLQVNRGGRPSSPGRPQPHHLKVKTYGVALISKTMLFVPEQWIVPAGIRKWSCLRPGHLFP